MFLQMLLVELFDQVELRLHMVMEVVVQVLELAWF